MAFRNMAIFLALTMAYFAVVSAGKLILNITDATIAPDGQSRPAVLANGTFPGPILQGNKGDRFNITVVNQLQDVDMLTDTTIHWHGIFQTNTSWADGPAFVTQCPIVTGDSFDYNFHVEQAGTYWYHSHLSVQYCDGLRGALVIYDPNDPYLHKYDVDDESTVITLADWYHTLAQKMPVPAQVDSTLINGLGIWSQGNTTTGKLAVINVVSGVRYRIRLVSISCDPNYLFSIDNHTMTIIEADGVSSQPHTVDQIQIFAGQRYSFILTASQKPDNYWIRANPNTGNVGFANAVNSAILRYSTANKTNPVSSPPKQYNLLKEVDLRPFDNLTVPGQPFIGGVPPDGQNNLVFGFNQNAGLFTVNNVSYESYPIPVLLQILNGTQNAHDLLPKGSVYSLPKNTPIEITMPGGLLGGPHPFHLHGHKFAVVRSAGSTTYNYKDPIWRDTVSIGATGDNVTIRFMTDNPGPWFLHCHIDWHLEAGLAVVFAEDIPDTSNVVKPTQQWFDLCPTYMKTHPNISLARIPSRISMHFDEEQV
ncbi:laccase 2 [Cristinia sonorae]|uniref:Laccase 2 n=1 Tax=Cristinia sonorae TaxID=1940300 RepID=A0A8K0UFP2_9AGAR|nr:laccase 2 [Cristinia sonorae]